MKRISIINDHIYSVVGSSTDACFENMLKANSGLELIEDKRYSPESFFGGRIEREQFDEDYSKLSKPYTFDSFFERLIVYSMHETLKEDLFDHKSEKVLVILSSTKGNIADKQKSDNLANRYLWKSAERIRDYFGFYHPIRVVSNACISGTFALIQAYRLLDLGIYEHIIVCGADVLSDFVVSGFQSFKALSSEMCKPYDKNRLGINIGEAVGTMILSKSIDSDIQVLAGTCSNDANHISGPSRTGEGLYQSIKKSLKEANLSQVDFINAHGTATLYNDEMEALAYHRAALGHVPLNSLKAYWGHTLGASGLIETIISAKSIRENKLIASLGFHEMGTSKALNIIQKAVSKTLNNCLKSSSGFGGVNASIILSI